MACNESDLMARYVPRGRVLNRNYELLPGFMQFGEGDLLVDEGECLSAIEFKYIDQYATGKTARSRRTQHRKRVCEQARLHAAYAKLRHPDRRVQAIAVTNEGATMVHRDVCTSAAAQRVWTFIQTVDHGMVPSVASNALKELFARTR